mmetsp:Transcript_46824/g.144993  ORF Transcript_46824/g.144993 Transcript_46824/m.144993 type:complete len:238 (+) Transcript_46824:939-1652(+)
MVAENVLHHEFLVLLCACILEKLLHLLQRWQSVPQSSLLRLDVGRQVQGSRLTLLITSLLEKLQSILCHLRGIVHRLRQHRGVHAGGHVIHGGNLLDGLGNCRCSWSDRAFEGENRRFSAEDCSGNDLVAQVNLHQREHCGRLCACPNGLAHAHCRLGLLEGQLGLARDEVGAGEHTQRGHFLLGAILQQIRCLFGLVQCSSEVRLRKGLLRGLSEVGAVLEVLGRHPSTSRLPAQP